MTWDRVRSLDSRVGLPVFVIAGAGFVFFKEPLRWWFAGLGGVVLAVHLAVLLGAMRSRKGDETAP